MLFSDVPNWKRLLRLCGLVSLLMFTTGCSGDSKSGGTPTDPGGGSGVLFQDDYSGTSLSSAWTPTIYGGGTVEIDVGTGQPAPSLHIQSDSTVNGRSLAMLSQPYNNASGVSFTIQVEVGNPGRAGPNLDGIRIVIDDQGRTTAQAGVTIQRFAAGSNNVNISYDVYPGNYPWQLVKEWNLALSPGFHEFRYTVYPDLTAKWFRDGIQRLSTLTGAQMIETDLQLKLDVRGPDAAARFDNAVVSR